MITRILIPGAEWLYFKIYTGMKSADIILSEIICPFTESLLLSKTIDKWFFIRYEDPRFHIRMRVKISQGGSFDTILSTFHRMFEPLLQNGIITNLQLDCYKREIERYGENSMEISEEIFFIDSAAITKMVVRLRKTGDSDETRWLLAMKLVDDTLSAAGFNTINKIRFIEVVDTSFRKEFNMTSSSHTKILNSKYRDHRKNIEDMMSHKGHYELYKDILQERVCRLKSAFDKLMICGGYNIENLMPSYTHMTLNRLFRSKNRQCEMVIYYLMNKYYASHMARENLKINEKVSSI